MKAMGKVTLTLGLMIIVSLFLTSCSGVVTPEISMGNSNNPSSNNPNSNNYQNPSTDPVEETVMVATEESATNPSSNNPNSNNYQNPSTDPVEEPATEEPATEEVDTTKPVITGLRDPLPNSFGWNNTDVTVSFSCADTGPVQSGIDINTVAGETVTTEGKDQSVTNTGVCTDVAGNTADPVTVSNINIDKTPPVVTFTLPGTGEYVLNQSITATWSATDALSGVVSPVSGTVSIDTSSVGTKIFTLPAGTALDKAGNSSLKVTKSYSVIADTEDPEMIYPQKWATGTGTVSDPWANNCLNSALTNCPNNGTIFLKAGYYLLSSVLYTSTKSFNLIGEGMGKSIIVLDITDQYGIYIEADYCTLRGFTIDGASQTDGGKSAIGIGYCDYTLVEDIEAKNSGDSGINLFQVNHSSLQNIYVHDNYAHGIHPGSNAAGRNMYNTYRDIYAWDNDSFGFYDRGCSEGDNIIEECYNVYDNIQAWDNTLYGIGIEYQKGATISNCHATGNGSIGLGFYELSNSNISNCVVKLNGITKEMSAVLTIYSGNLNFTNIIVLNNYNGFEIINCAGIRLNSCQSYDDRDIPLQLCGLGLNGTNTGISLTDCTLSPNALGDIYNPNGVAVEVITTDKMLARLY